jgi:hypothetical protein
MPVYGKSRKWCYVRITEIIRQKHEKASDRACLPHNRKLEIILGSMRLEYTFRSAQCIPLVFGVDGDLITMANYPQTTLT